MDGISERFFQIEQEWNVVHLPEKPNGFGVLIIGDKSHYVDEDSSFWIQHYGRRQLLHLLRASGYTVFYSNLYGRHWGSPKATMLSKELYYLVQKKEILNKRIHIIAEGMGALTALQLMEIMGDDIRSVSLLNPCIQLKEQLQLERENKFFYKRMIRELSIAYGLDEKEVEKQSFAQISNFKSTVPVRIWQKMYGSPYTYQLHSKVYEEYRTDIHSPIQLTFYLPENATRVYQMMMNYLRSHERIL
ncbi:hypothetical protein [Bacillus kexueae]|uniref:hypothetical protein n=1 Tax=Aeribacillus kexueae TaxID=2078952 RepID=UPI001FAEC990|nr:hypothetical protein [Bacillus kexueae]